MTYQLRTHTTNCIQSTHPCSLAGVHRRTAGSHPAAAGSRSSRLAGAGIAPTAGEGAGRSPGCSRPAGGTGCIRGSLGVEGRAEARMGMAAVWEAQVPAGGPTTSAAGSPRCSRRTCSGVAMRWGADLDRTNERRTKSCSCGDWCALSATQPQSQRVQQTYLASHCSIQPGGRGRLSGLIGGPLEL